MLAKVVGGRDENGLIYSTLQTRRNAMKRFWKLMFDLLLEASKYPTSPCSGRRDKKIYERYSIIRGMW
jgi:hypothetical protein